MSYPIQPWFWRSLPLEKRTGSQVFEALFLMPQRDRRDPYSQIQAIATLLESPYPTPTQNPQARYSICAGSPRIIDNRPQLWTPEIGEILPFLRQLLQRQREEAIKFSEEEKGDRVSTGIRELPFTGGWLGWLGYDLAWEIEKLPYLNADPLPFPVAYWYEPACFAILDHHQQKLWLAASDRRELDVMQTQLEKVTAFPENLRNNYSLNLDKSGNLINLKKLLSHQFYFQTSQNEYENRVKKAKKYIKIGDIFQANLTLRFEAETSAKSWDVYRKLQQINPSPFASYWHSPWGDVVSCSPERLVQLRGQCAETRPIAGTRSRGETPEQDDRLAAELLANTKERAEHIMLVDLERNDLGRVCEWGTVQVNELLTIEKYSHVMHLVSNAIGKLESDRDAVDAIRALFPGGTITGCPKVRCMEIIEELESVRRSLFYGSCGYLDWRGNLDLNILIRTLLFAPEPKRSPTQEASVNLVWGQVGAGIVADSDPEKEWDESLHKAEAQLAALTEAS